MLFRILQIGSSFSLFLFGGHLGEFPRIEVPHAVPAGQILTVEEGLEASRRLIVLLGRQRSWTECERHGGHDQRPCQATVHR